MDIAVDAIAAGANHNYGCLHRAPSAAAHTQHVARLLFEQSCSRRCTSCCTVPLTNLTHNCCRLLNLPRTCQGALLSNQLLLSLIVSCLSPGNCTCINISSAAIIGASEAFAQLGFVCSCSMCNFGSLQATYVFTTGEQYSNLQTNAGLEHHMWPVLYGPSCMQTHGTQVLSGAVCRTCTQPCCRSMCHAWTKQVCMC